MPGAGPPLHAAAGVLPDVWQALEDHEVGFRKSEQYQRCRSLLHHFYDIFPSVLHYQKIVG